VAWIFTLGVLAHNTEEAIYLPAWEARYLPPPWAAWIRQRRYAAGAKEFRFAAVILSAALLIITALSSATGAGSIASYLLAGYAFAMIVNSLIPHVAVTVMVRRYMPGTGTAILLNLPLGCWFLLRAITEHYVRPELFAWTAPLVALFILASLPLLVAVGKRL
jgi:hypothetical protein